jgi:hypothetical protein
VIDDRTVAGRRPMTRLATAGLAAHVYYELAAGVGMPFASVLGPIPAATGWAIGIRAVWRAALTRPATADLALGLWNGLGLAAVLAHFAGWPRRWTRTGLPWLRECEGLSAGLMPAYNIILYVSGTAAVVAVVRENRSASRGFPVLALALAPALVVLQRAEHRRLRELARRRPGWWNRRLR